MSLSTEGFIAVLGLLTVCAPIVYKLAVVVRSRMRPRDNEGTRLIVHHDLMAD